MERDYFISVAMATYNGEKYIKEQIDSILNQKIPVDEIIVSDDGSTDNTLNILREYRNEKIKIIDGPKKGIKQNFANAIKNTTGDVIFLSDQDDIWEKEKTMEIMQVFKNNNYSLIVHNATIVDENLDEIGLDTFSWRKSGPGVIKNIIKNTYIGCCMAFKKEIVDYILPIPNTIEMHDQWIGILNEKHGKSYFLNKKLIKYRRHRNNFSNMTHHSLNKMIFNRLVFINKVRSR